jgi:hypothetical protein
LTRHPAVVFTKVTVSVLSSVGTWNVTELVYESGVACGGPVTLLAVITAGSIFDSVVAKYSSVVYGLNASCHWAAVTPSCFTNAAAHFDATSNAAESGLAGVLFSDGDNRVAVTEDEADVGGTTPGAPCVDVGDADIEGVADTDVPGDAAWEELPVILGRMYPRNSTIARRKRPTVARCLGERSGHPHSLRYTAARPRLVRMGTSGHHRRFVGGLDGPASRWTHR